MHFPSWVDRTPKGRVRPDAERATNRLRYIASLLALEFDPRGSIRVLGERIGRSHVTLVGQMACGSFSRNTAMEIKIAIEIAKGNHPITVEQLMYPLSIESTNT